MQISKIKDLAQTQFSTIWQFWSKQQLFSKISDTLYLYMLKHVLCEIWELFFGVLQNLPGSKPYNLSIFRDFYIQNNAMLRDNRSLYVKKVRKLRKFGVLCEIYAIICQNLRDFNQAESRGLCNTPKNNSHFESIWINSWFLRLRTIISMRTMYIIDMYITTTIWQWTQAFFNKAKSYTFQYILQNFISPSIRWEMLFSLKTIQNKDKDRCKSRIHMCPASLKCTHCVLSMNSLRVITQYDP